MNILKISTTPIQLSMTSQRARLESQIPDPDAGIITSPGNFKMHSENIKVNIDTFESRRSMGFRTAAGLMKDAAQAGMQAAQDATAQYAQIGSQMAQIQTGATVADIVGRYTMPNPAVTEMKFIPAVGPDISWEPNRLDMEYTPAKVEFHPNIDQKTMQYIPGELEINVEQFPKVDIEYVGEPLYVPPSASPSYEGE